MVKVTSQYQRGYDILGRECIITVKDGIDKYVTHIPGNISCNEVIDRLSKGDNILFDARNQGMQNNLGAQVDTSCEVQIAHRDEWPLFIIWHIKWTQNYLDNDNRTFDEYKEYIDSKNLSASCKWRLIDEYNSYIVDKFILFDDFLKKFLFNIDIKKHSKL